jgi:hypothetical protein
VQKLFSAKPLLLVSSNVWGSNLIRKLKMKSRKPFSISPKTTIKKLLSVAKKCNSDDLASKFCEDFQSLLSGLSCDCLEVFNPEGYIESDGTPYIRFELARVFSDSYIYEISPLIQDGELTIMGRLNHMKDGHGTNSQDYEILDGWDDEVSINPSDTVDVVLARAINLMLVAHKKLIEDAGVPSHIAKKTAIDSWNGPVFQENI